MKTTKSEQAHRPNKEAGGFTLKLENFSGPFDLLLHLIARKKLDITDIALAEVTDEFLHYLPNLDKDTDRALDEASEFLVTAASLLELKLARLLPRHQDRIAENTALLETRDLLFARLLQYRAYRDVAEIFEEKYALENQEIPRSVGLDPVFAQALPDLVFDLGPEEFARLAAQALLTAPDGAKSGSGQEPDSQDQKQLEHLSPPITSVAAQEEVILERLKHQKKTSLTALLASSSALEIAIFRFFAILELYRNGLISLKQEASLAEVEVELTYRGQAGALATDLPEGAAHD